VRVTLQPVDVPAGEAQTLARTLDHIGSDRMLLFSTDYPHWHFDGEDALPDGLSRETIRRLAIDNPLETFPRLREEVQMSDSAAGQEKAR
jgi:predicted TIM-barrel fold metal-dependent hydrolase